MCYLQYDNTICCANETSFIVYIYPDNGSTSQTGDCPVETGRYFFLLYRFSPISVKLNKELFFIEMTLTLL